MKYKLLKDINHPFGNKKAGIAMTIHDWLDEFGLDWLTDNENNIEKNPKWFELEEKEKGEKNNGRS